MRVSPVFTALHLCVSDMNRDAPTWTAMGVLRHKSRHSRPEMRRVSSFYRAAHDEGRLFPSPSDVVQPPRLQQKAATAFSLFGKKKLEENI